MKKYINLLPPESQKQIRLGRVNAQFFDFGIWVVLSLLIFSAVLFVSLLFLRGNLEGTQEEVARQSRALAEVKEAPVKKEVEEYNKNLKNFETLVQTREPWSKVLMEIAKNLPADMTIDTMSISRLERKVELAGHARTRGSVLQFRGSLLNSRLVRSVNFPLMNLEKPRDLKWKYRFFVQEEFLQ